LQQLAAVPPSEKFDQSAIDLPRALRAELRRVGSRWVQAGQTRLSYRWSKVGLRRHYGPTEKWKCAIDASCRPGQIARHYSARARLPGALPHVKSFISRVVFRLMNTLFNY
jgi:hypothetical protein